MPFNEVYWLDGWNGNATGGFYTRSDIFKSIKQFEENFKKKVVGIKIKDEWTLEFICEGLET